MRLGFGLGLGTSRGRSTLALLLGGVAIGPIALRWIDLGAWNDDLTWKDAA